MYEIRKALEENYENMRSFLSEVPSINQIDDEVLKNAIIIFLYDKMKKASFAFYCMHFFEFSANLSRGGAQYAKRHLQRDAQRLFFC